MADEGTTTEPPRGYIVTGRAAHGRVGRLFQKLLREQGRRRPQEEEWGREDDGPRSSSPSAPDDRRERADRRDVRAPERAPDRWIDVSPHAEKRPASGGDDDAEEGCPAPPPPTAGVDFLWENAPRSETKTMRDGVRVYSHLPHGILMDDKWALARLLGRHRKGRNDRVAGGKRDGDDDIDGATEDPDLAVLETHCFRGAEFGTFARRVGLLPPEDGGDDAASADDRRGTATATTATNHQWEDLLYPPASSGSPPPPPRNLWVVKDAASNGAGGIWIVDESNARDFLGADDGDTPPPGDDRPPVAPPVLGPTRRHVAQRYAWPPALYGGRKCHLRAYALMTADGRAYVHRRAFLHVANEPFRHRAAEGGGTRGGGGFEASVHITNCCANSHDPSKFAGEVCADLEAPGPHPARARGASDGGERPPDADENEAILPLGDYLPSVSASVAALAQSAAPFVWGGEANRGFEYLGLDFVLSSAAEGDGSTPADGPRRRRPQAYLLEVNAPPAQDTATGLPRAEDLHDEVVSDLLRMWVLPGLGLEGGRRGGWRCVHAPPAAKAEDGADSNNPVVPSKAAILNRIRWAIFERRALKEEESLRSSGNEREKTARNGAKRASPSGDDGGPDGREREDIDACESRKAERGPAFDPDAFVAFARSQFPYFSEPSKPPDADAPGRRAAVDGRIFFESGGGAQVPRVVSDAVAASMSDRDRSVVGAARQREARAALSSLLIDGADADAVGGDGGRGRGVARGDRVPILGPNATSLLDSLARKICAGGAVAEGDNIVIASENHLANVTPWLEAAKAVGAEVRWWTVADADGRGAGDDGRAPPTASCILSELVDERTRVVAISHASNILGTVRDVESVCRLVRRATRRRGQVVVDGVAAAPHLLSSPGTAVAGVDWYVASLHKLFGPHLGCLVGRRCRVAQLHRPEDELACEGEAPLSDETLCKSWEMGTMNYEACCGAIGLKEYFETLAIHARERFGIGRDDSVDVTNDGCCQTSNQITSETSNDHLGGDGVDASHEGGHTASEASSYVNIARICIQRVEIRLLEHLLGCLRKCAPLVRVVQDTGEMKVTHGSEAVLVDDENRRRIPIVCFVHAGIPSREIVRHCRNHGVVCRACKFLSTRRFWDELGVEDDGLVRFSLAHYNTLEEIDRSIRILEMLVGWS